MTQYPPRKLTILDGRIKNNSTLCTDAFFVFQLLTGTGAKFLGQNSTCPLSPTPNPTVFIGMWRYLIATKSGTPGKSANFPRASHVTSRIHDGSTDRTMATMLGQIKTKFQTRIVHPLTYWCWLVLDAAPHKDPPFDAIFPETNPGR